MTRRSFLSSLAALVIVPKLAIKPIYPKNGTLRIYINNDLISEQINTIMIKYKDSFCMSTIEFPKPIIVLVRN